MILPNGTHTNAFSPEGIAATPVASYNREAVHWFQRDRREALEGSMVWSTKEGKETHDGSGLEKAQQDLRRLRADLAAEHNPNHSPTSRYQVLAIMVEQQGYLVQFYEGKIALLDRLIAAAQTQPRNPSVTSSAMAVSIWSEALFMASSFMLSTPFMGGAVWLSFIC